MYTKAEVSQAKEAYVIMKNGGFPLLDELVEMVENGNILEMPNISSRVDIKRAYELNGIPVECTRGKLTKKHALRVRYKPVLWDY